MNIDGRHYRTIWLHEDSNSVEIIDQTKLPHEFSIVRLVSLEEAARAIVTMQVRGAPLIGATAAYGLYLAMRQNPSDAALAEAARRLKDTRPTAVNLAWAVDEMLAALQPLEPQLRAETAKLAAALLCDDDVEICRRIGVHGLRILEDLVQARGGERINILTHCNAGWLACVDWGTALAPIYMAHDAGLAVHVWVDETRPRNQGAALTAYELKSHGVPHTLVVDNAGGHFMQKGMVDICIVGTDRTTATGDVANKIGTYLKALAAQDNGVPFYVALPSATIDWSIEDGIRDIPIEERGQDEVITLVGRDENDELRRVLIAPEGTQSANPAFDVTPARLVSGLITERGVCAASRAGLAELFPEKNSVSGN
jgi:methylthioribose-1-phosphate isomerase